jgi:predicted TPR repeat methyltransferase
MNEGTQPVEELKISVEAALGIAIDFHKLGKVEDAVEVYEVLLSAYPDYPDAVHYLGVAKHQLGDSEDAIELLKRSLELAPGNVNAINNLGNIYRELGKLEHAEECYRDVLALAPQHVDTLINMAVSLRGLKKTDEALKVVKGALEINPEHPQAWHNLGNIYRDQKQYDDALSAYQKSVMLDPADEDSSLEVARIMALSGRQDDAIEVLKRFLKRHPENAIARHTLASVGGEDIPDRASDAYVRTTFDNYAKSFDESLARLEYIAPRKVADEVLAFAGDRQLDVLDVGCGTGLCGPLLRPVANSLVGIDLSSAMLKKAQQREVYDDLAEAELTTYLLAADAQYDVIICVDTLVYFGKIDEAIAAASKCLRAGGCLVFTLERHGVDVSMEDFRLQHHGRYSHSDEYVTQTIAASGLKLERLEHIVPRKELGEPVSGALIVAYK